MQDARKPPTKAPATGTDRSPPRYRSEDLFAGTKLLVIVHSGREYSLRVTAANKLILTA